jgi:hypothetical protein
MAQKHGVSAVLSNKILFLTAQGFPLPKFSDQEPALGEVTLKLVPSRPPPAPNSNHMKILTPRRLLPAVAAFAAISSANAATFFNEDFSDFSPNPNLALGTGYGTNTTSFASGDFRNSTGDTHRIYLGTNDTSYFGSDFIFQATVTFGASTSAWSAAFIGMGDSDATAAATYGEPSVGPHVYMSLRPDNNTIYSSDGLPTANTSEDNSIGTVPSGTHLVRMRWNAALGQATFEFDNGNNGSIDGTFTLNGADNGFNSTNSQLFIGGGNGLIVDNISVSAVPEPSTYGLIGAGALAAVAFVRRRRRL